MFEFDQETVHTLLDSDERFRRLYDKHTSLNARVDAANSGDEDMEHFELEILKKEKLLLRDQMQAMISAYSATR